MFFGGGGLDNLCVSRSAVVGEEDEVVGMFSLDCTRHRSGVTC